MSEEIKNMPVELSVNELDKVAGGMAAISYPQVPGVNVVVPPVSVSFNQPGFPFGEEKKYQHQSYESEKFDSYEKTSES